MENVHGCWDNHLAFKLDRVRISSADWRNHQPFSFAPPTCFISACLFKISLVFHILLPPNGGASFPSCAGLSLLPHNHSVFKEEVTHPHKHSPHFFICLVVVLQVVVLCGDPTLHHTVRGTHAGLSPWWWQIHWPSVRCRDGTCECWAVFSFFYFFA